MDSANIWRKGTLAKSLDGIIDQADAQIVIVRVPHDANADKLKANVIGTNSGGVPTGIQALRRAKSLCGFAPKILGAPELDSQAVAAELVGVAQATRAFVYASAGGAAGLDEVKAYRANFGQREIMLVDNEFTAFDPVSKSGTATRAQERELSRLQMQGHRLRDSFFKQAGSIRENAAALRKSGVDTRNLADGQQLLKNRMEQVSATTVRQKAALERLAAAEGRMKSAGAMAGTIGLKAAGYGLFARQVGRGLSHPVKAAMDEEDAMLGIVKQVQGLKNADNSLNHAEIAKVRTEIQGLSRELPVATTEIMAMYEAGARMDVPRQELAGYVKTAAIAATAFDAEDMGALAENLGRINKNFKLSAEQGRELADVINYLDDNSLSKGAELIEYMNRVSGW